MSKEIKKEILQKAYEAGANAMLDSAFVTDKGEICYSGFEMERDFQKFYDSINPSPNLNESKDTNICRCGGNIIRICTNCEKKASNEPKNTKPEGDAIGKPLEDYIRAKHTQEECSGFIDGWNAAQQSTQALRAENERLQDKYESLGLSMLNQDRDFGELQSELQQAREDSRTNACNFVKWLSLIQGDSDSQKHNGKTVQEMYDVYLTTFDAPTGKGEEG